MHWEGLTPNDKTHVFHHDLGTLGSLAPWNPTTKSQLNGPFFHPPSPMKNPTMHERYINFIQGPWLNHSNLPNPGRWSVKTSGCLPGSLTHCGKVPTCAAGPGVVRAAKAARSNQSPLGILLVINTKQRPKQSDGWLCICICIIYIYIYSIYNSKMYYYSTWGTRQLSHQQTSRCSWNGGTDWYNQKHGLNPQIMDEYRRIKTISYHVIQCVLEIMSCCIWIYCDTNDMIISSLSGWWYTNPSEKYESQLGLLFTIYGKIKNVPNDQPDHAIPIVQNNRQSWLKATKLMIPHVRS